MIISYQPGVDLYLPPRCRVCDKYGNSHNFIRSREYNDRVPTTLQVARCCVHCRHYSDTIPFAHASAPSQREAEALLDQKGIRYEW